MLTKNETRLDVLRAVAEGRVTFTSGEGYWIRLPGMQPDNVTITKEYSAALTDLSAHEAIRLLLPYLSHSSVTLTKAGLELLKEWTV